MVANIITTNLLKQDNRNVSHWHLRISYINKKGAETSTSFPYDEFQSLDVSKLAEIIQRWQETNIAL